MILPIINCVYADGEVCRAMVYSPLDPTACASLCTSRQPRNDGPTIVYSEAAASKGYDGSREWEALHKRALAYGGDVQAERAWLEQFAKGVRCGQCRSDWMALVAKYPPDFNDLFTWSVARHNDVSARLGKPAMSIEDALKRWAPQNG